MHRPVLFNDVLHYWQGRRGGFYIDATSGMGGHAQGLLESDGEASCLALDCDQEAVELSRERLKVFGQRAMIVKDNYKNLKEIVKKYGLPKSNGILFDLGFSSLQVDSYRRGFSFGKKGPLDMRMDASQGETAAELIHRMSVSGLARIIRDWGEEKRSLKIASALKEADQSGRLSDTLQCAETVRRALVSSGRGKREGIHPVTKTFQALRIAVNHELENLDAVLADVPDLLSPGGRVVFLSFHSLEDRRVKSALKNWSDPCVCPPSFPKCVCGKSPSFRILTRKALRPGKEEMEENPRSRSARMRAAEKI